MSGSDIKKVVIPVLALLLCSIVVLLERNGVTREYTEDAARRELEFTEAVQSDAEALVLYNSGEEYSKAASDMTFFVLDNMCVGYDTADLAASVPLQFDRYQTVVLALEDWSSLGDSLFAMCDWVKQGGRVLSVMTPLPEGNFRAVAQKLGIVGGGSSYASVDGIHINRECMVGAQQKDTFSLGEEPLQISLAVELEEKAEVYVESADGTVPLLWANDYGEGRFVVMNEMLTEKYKRGFLCLGYSLLQDACIYPVINASAFYLDDFPSPVPGGNGTYVKRDYGLDIGTFYSTVWWPKVLGWCEDYGIRYTGMIIEVYSDQVAGEFERNKETAQFITFGNMLLNNGGELGFHGYNHMPLCLKGVDDARQYGDYELWESPEAMTASIEELQGFSSELFPQAQFSVYVPPSNIMSESGLAALLRACPEINVIAATLLRDADGRVYEQEFGVDENGMIHTPRVTSGCNMDDYALLTVLSELNLHYVQSHFMHPDDTLDEDRGAELGWETLSGNLRDYIDWVYATAPDIRNTTGSEMGTAVLQYDKLSVKRSLQENRLTVELGGFSGEAYFLLRVNEGRIRSAENCTYVHVTDNLYLVHATADVIEIDLGE